MVVATVAVESFALYSLIVEWYYARFSTVMQFVAAKAN